jgi:hypothetical protein
MENAGRGQSQQVDQTAEQPTTQGAVPFGLSECDLNLLREEAKKAFREALSPRMARTIDEFLDKQVSGSVNVTKQDANLLVARYGEAVRNGAERLAKELGEAVGNRQGLGSNERQWIESQIDALTGEFISPAAEYLCAELMSSFTIANPQEAKQMLSDSLSRLAESSLLTRGSKNALDLALARHGTNRVQQSGDFVYSPDYRSVSFRGNTLSFTSRQAQVVEMLHQALVRGAPELGQDYILEELDSPNSRLRDTFKNHPAWNLLIVKGKGRGTYRLNLLTHPQKTKRASKSLLALKIPT